MIEVIIPDKAKPRCRYCGKVVEMSEGSGLYIHFPNTDEYACDNCIFIVMRNDPKVKWGEA